MIGGWPGPAASVGVALRRPVAIASGDATPCLPAPLPPLTSTRCRRTPLSVRAARTCTPVVAPVHTGSPACWPPAGPASGPCPLLPAATQPLHRPPAPRNRSQTLARAGASHSRPTRSTGRASSMVASLDVSRPSQCSESTGCGGPSSIANAPRGRSSPPANAPAEPASSDLRVTRRELITPGHRKAREVARGCARLGKICSTRSEGTRPRAPSETRATRGPAPHPRSPEEPSIAPGAPKGRSRPGP